MLIVSFVSGFLIFIMANSISVMASVLISIICAVVGTVVELFTPSEYDTVTVPAVIAFICLIIYP